MYPGGHWDQLVNMCPAISEDVLHSPMSKNNSNNDAAADHTYIKEDRGAFLDPVGHWGRAGLLGLVRG